ncbi:MAG: GreA/GreB family elongation factor [Kiritimatiellae bacterium]|nr:GreA/GreB family elongation factor [Kiritimatiellia bacterium]
MDKLNECAANLDFDGAVKTVRANLADIEGRLKPSAVAEVLKKATKDRLLASFVDGADFSRGKIDESLVRLERLTGFVPGALVLNVSWGLGKVRKADYFYKRITVDFKTKPGHQFSYAAAVDMLVPAPEDHILVVREIDPVRFDKLLKETPGEFVKAVLKSYGDMSVQRLEDVCAANGFVKKTVWKAFWEKARAELRSDKRVEIPVKRADPIRIKESAEDFGDRWVERFSRETDPKLILAGVREFTAPSRFKTVSDETKAVLEDRLAFAVTAARKTDDALYARLACLVKAFGFSRPALAEMREYLWERKRFVKAAAALPSRDVGALVEFLAVDDETKGRLYAALPDLPFAAVSEIVTRFAGEAALREAVGALLKAPKAPATLVTLVAGRYEQFKDWSELPSLAVVLTHAIALGEGRQSGETLKMQNMTRRLFSDVKWLEKMFSFLDASDRAVIFERFQASIAWEASTHHAITVRMSKLDPELEKHVVKIEKKREYVRMTSRRSYALKKAEYLKLINEDMPANVKRIEFAKSYGDLSENAEYQYAKDEQRALMQKQSLMQKDLEDVKAGDFAGADTSEVMPGTGVVVAVPGGERTYWILGEWDNDIEMGILSSKAQLAVNLMGKKKGEKFNLPVVDGPSAEGEVKDIIPLSDRIREWMAVPAGLQI